MLLLDNRAYYTLHAAIRYSSSVHALRHLLIFGHSLGWLVEYLLLLLHGKYTVNQIQPEAYRVTLIYRTSCPAIYNYG